MKIKKKKKKKKGTSSKLCHLSRGTLAFDQGVNKRFKYKMKKDEREKKICKSNNRMKAEGLELKCFRLVLLLVFEKKIQGKNQEPFKLTKCVEKMRKKINIQI